MPRPAPCSLPSGVLIAAPRSGSGKTVLTLGLLAALRRTGVAVASAKVGPDYIDPAFHQAASGRPCLNLDRWAMRDSTLRDSIATLADSSTLIVAEGVMGLFDGAAAPRPDSEASASLYPADGSTASLASWSGWPVILVIDVSGQTASAAAVARGFASHHPSVIVAGVILNRVASDRHAALLRDAFARSLPEMPILGTVPRSATLEIPQRHLGLVQAEEHLEMASFLDKAAHLIHQHIDLTAVCAAARPFAPPPLSNAASGPDPLGSPATAPFCPQVSSMAIARDAAFAFAYAGHLSAWQRAGIALHPFSPLNDEAPAADAEMVFLPGGYPELHAAPLSQAETFRHGMKAAAARGAWIYGECGGYMVLGQRLEDANGDQHPMLGLLPIETSFARRRLHLGYRRAVAAVALPFATAGSLLYGHEFHYARETSPTAAQPAFHAHDAEGHPVPPMGAAQGRVIGSFLHVIDRG